MPRSAKRRPRIGVPWRTTKQEAKRDMRYNGDYLRAVRRAGGEPVQISLRLPPAELKRVAASLDGLVLPGSPADVSPRRYRATKHKETTAADMNREHTDIALLDDAFAARKPVLAICYGTQLLNVHRGGTLVQDIASQIRGVVGHDHELNQPQTLHAVRLSRGRIARLAKLTTVSVNSSHHQSIRRPGRGLRVTARASDGVVEAIEGAGPQWLVGVQWHPERMPPPLRGDPHATKDGAALADALFAELVAQARHRAQTTKGNLRAKNGVNIQSRSKRKRR